MKIKCLIVDDEPLAIQVIETYLKNLQEFEIVSSCNTAVEALNILQNQKIDLLFLDINMPMLNGLELLKTLDKGPEVILTTAHREYALEGFDLSVVDYLLKPISFQRFLKAVNKVNRVIHLNSLEKYKNNTPVINSNFNKQPSSRPHIFLKVDKKMVKVYLDEILYIESLKDYIRVFTEQEDLIVHQTLSKIVEMLPSEEFIRIHRSFAVALRKVSAIEGNQVEVKGKALPIGRLYQQNVKEAIYKRSVASA
ncbi:LytTR family DNA-binding domain-containing protein [Algivirga pacifica]|uniref:LytTR family DNA-binding domain-containing protein n=1 Tax=Algivirga pacifica TaxID=1162670 RepID=A0ABP9DAI8_9BACT